MQKFIWSIISSTTTVMQRNSYVLMKLELCFVLKLFLSFSEILNLIILVNFILIEKERIPFLVQ